jgi:alpha-D-ribose 1-methylphosphonate 5-triphosphate synthase subunit PhnH
MVQASTSPAVIEGGFANPVHDAQRVFAAVMNAFAMPGNVEAVTGFAIPPAPMNAVAGAICCTLCDADTPVWLGPRLRTDAISGWLSFQTGAQVTDDPAQAVFAVLDDVAVMPALERFAQGSQEYPDRSTTLILQVETLETGEPLDLRGPGIRDAAIIAPAPLPPHFLTQWQLNRKLFPRGVDLVLATADAICCLPRTTQIAMQDNAEA